MWYTFFMRCNLCGAIYVAAVTATPAATTATTTGDDDDDTGGFTPGDDDNIAAGPTTKAIREVRTLKCKRVRGTIPHRFILGRPKAGQEASAGRRPAKL